MANNPYANKIELADGTVLIDISSDTVTAGKMLSGTAAHDKSGAPIIGTIPSKTGSDLTVSGDTVTVPAGYYAETATKQVEPPTDCLIFSVTATASTSKTVSDSEITSDYYVFNMVSTAPTADIGWATASGSLTLTCADGIPAMTVFLCRQL